ncbi:hypothetical protein EG327_005828 [Venturia inaequalis]|uniref:Chromo domain-containing protein n=1 Tax=Venturia inaequalis TaxID=5025 RepID=A0A8H3V8P1_VENIN|nr:hypothetical protein EG327_005828 [Venturia inaequalis]
MEIPTAFTRTSKSSSYPSSLAVSTAASSCGRRSSGSQTPLSSIHDEIQSGLDSASHKELYVTDDDLDIIESLEGGSVYQSDEALSWHQKGTMDIDENMYALASTAHMHYQLSHLIGYDDMHHGAPVDGDYQEVVYSSVPDSVDECHRVTLREQSASVLNAPIELARQQVNDAAIFASERGSATDAGDSPPIETNNTHMALSGIDKRSNTRDKYKVEAILDHDMVKGSSYYRVKWYGWPTM